MVKFKSYLEKMRGKHVAVLGVGISNMPLISLLVSHGALVTACDRKTEAELLDVASELKSMGVMLKCGADYLKGLECEYIFRTPGMRPDLKELLELVRNGSILTSEMEAFFEVCPCHIIGVTGSDGKTTTATLISKMLAEAGYTCHLGGNIGRPLFSVADRMKENDIAVLELSSFQLMTMKKSPKTSVITNISPNHLDVHKSMEEYVSAKENIYLHQDEDGILVLNADNALTAGLKNKACGRTIMFSSKSTEADVHLKDGAIYVSENGSLEKILNVSDILIPGSHNIENYMAAIAATRGLIGAGTVLSVAKSFPGVEHRIEFVAEKNGIRFYNDSIASSPTRTIAGLHSFDKKVILIAGGYDKHIPFDVLGPEITAHVKALILTGDTREKIRVAVEKSVGYNAETLPVEECDNLESAVNCAKGFAATGDIVLMSPACASFDSFKNFEERGLRFKQIVNSL